MTRVNRKRQFNGKPISNTRRVERVLNIITYLQVEKTIKQIALELKIHQKSVHRYLNLLVQLGFEVAVIHDKRINRYKILNTSKYFNLE